MGNTQSLRQGQVPREKSQAIDWAQIGVALALYAIILMIGITNTKEGGEKWWTVAVVAIACHMYLSIIVINERQLGAMFILGRAVGDLESGPHFAFWPLCYVHRATQNIIQLEIGVPDTPEEKRKAALLVSSESKYLLEDPLYVNWGDINSAVGVSDDERKRFEGNPYADAMVTATHVAVMFRIWSLTSLIKKAGSVTCLWQLLLAHFGGLIWPTLGRCRLGKAFAWPSRKNKDRRRSCGNVGIPPLWRDFQGRWEEWETVLGFSTLSTARHFHS